MGGLGATFTAMLTTTVTATTAIMVGMVRTSTGAVAAAEAVPWGGMGDGGAIGTVSASGGVGDGGAIGSVIEMPEGGGQRGIASWIGRTGGNGSRTEGGIGSESVRDLAVVVVIRPARLCRELTRIHRRTETQGVLSRTRG